MQFLKRLVQSYRDANLKYQYDFIASQDPWSEDDAKTLAGFLLTEAGKKLNARLRNFVFETAVRATRNPFNASYHNGVANGVYLAVDEIQRLNFAGLPRTVGTSEGEPQSSVAESLALN